MTRESARRLRSRECGRAFRDAWDAALDCAYAELEEAAMERCRGGVARPVFYKGEQIGEWRYHDERLTAFLLRFRRRHRFGPEADTHPRLDPNIPGVDPDEEVTFDPESQLEGGLVGIGVAFEPGPDDEEIRWSEEK